MNRLGCLFAIVFAATCLFTSCEVGKKGGTSGGSTGAPIGNAGTAGAGFLQTDFAPLAKWLDEAFNVDYKHMTPQVIFDQVPLNDIYYETSNLPTNAAPFNFANASISRRDLLRKIAQHWNLKMSLVLDAAGKPTAVKVEG